MVIAGQNSLGIDDVIHVMKGSNIFNIYFILFYFLLLRQEIEIFNNRYYYPKHFEYST
jgi:hypothetical protein